MGAISVEHLKKSENVLAYKDLSNPLVTFLFVQAENPKIFDQVSGGPLMTTSFDSSEVGSEVEEWMSSQMKSRLGLTQNQKLGVGALLSMIAATGLGIFMGRKHNTKKQKKKRQRKFVFDPKKPAFTSPVFNPDQEPTDSDLGKEWTGYSHAMKSLEVWLTPERILAQKDKVISLLNRNKEKLFPIPAWENPQFIINQAKLTTALLYRGSKLDQNEKSGLRAVFKRARDFWKQFENNKKLSRHDFVRLLC